MAKKLFHVVKGGYHPHNTWERREDGLYELAGSAYAFRDEEVKECTLTAQVYADACKCWKTPSGHACPLGERCVSTF